MPIEQADTVSRSGISLDRLDIATIGDAGAFDADVFDDNGFDALDVHNVFAHQSDSMSRSGLVFTRTTQVD